MKFLRNWLFGTHFWDVFCDVFCLEFVDPGFRGGVSYTYCWWGSCPTDFFLACPTNFPTVPSGLVAFQLCEFPVGNFRCCSHAKIANADANDLSCSFRHYCPLAIDCPSMSVTFCLTNFPWKASPLPRYYRPALSRDGAWIFKFDRAVRCCRYWVPFFFCRGTCLIYMLYSTNNSMEINQFNTSGNESV